MTPFPGAAASSSSVQSSALALAITTGDYTHSDTRVYWLKADVDHTGRVASFELTRFGSSEKYRLPADLSSCDCPDHTFREDRPGGCKHMVALRQALTALTSQAVPEPTTAVA
jgi:hypothetical protein